MKWIVSKEEAGLSIRQCLRKKFGNQYSSKTMNRWIDDGLFVRNERVELHGSTLLKKGDQIVLRKESKKKDLSSKFQQEKLLFEDDWILAYDKPAGITSEELFKIVRTDYPSILLVHRLDKNTTGVILFSKNSDSLRKFEHLFRQRKMKKVYLAVVDKVPELHKGLIQKKIGVLSHSGQAIRGIQKEGVPAITEWALKKKGLNAALLECFPYTGRTHQIRIHLASIGHPILGDYQYAKKYVCSYHPPRFLLHAIKLSFFHPFTKEEILIESPIPQDMKEALFLLKLF